MLDTFSTPSTRRIHSSPDWTSTSSHVVGYLQHAVDPSLKPATHVASGALNGTHFFRGDFSSATFILKLDNLYYHRIKWLDANGSMDLDANGGSDSSSPLVFGCGHEEWRQWDESLGTRGAVSKLMYTDGRGLP